jgi:transposase
MPSSSKKSNRDAVKSLWDQNIKNPREISQRTGVPLRSCERYVASLKKIGEIPPVGDVGRPKKLTPKKRRHIGKILKHDHFTTATELKAKLEENNPGFEVSEQTVQRELKRLGYVSLVPRRVPLLTQRHKDIRLEWAQKHLNYNWRKVVFSDETTMQMFRNTCRAWSKGEKPVAPMVKHPFKVHVWAAVNIRGKVGFHLFTENLDRHLYRKILNDHLYNNAGTVVGRQWVFQQDNDPKHTSKDVQADLERHLPNRVLPWPSYSPDMNPIENIWAVLKHSVEKRIKKMVAKKKKISQDNFIEIVREEWEELPQDVLLSSIGCMKKRLEACIAAEGGHTKY